MQFTGYVKVKEQVVKVLCRPNLNKKYIALKIRTTGEEGKYLEDESIFLSENFEIFRDLLDGKVIKL